MERRAPSARQPVPKPTKGTRRQARRGGAIAAALALVATTTFAISPEIAGAEVLPMGASTPGPEWTLIAQEDFSKQLVTDDAPWVHDAYGDDSPWNVDETDDDGSIFASRGGPGLGNMLDSFNLMRKRVEFGDKGWLTAEYVARDNDKDGVPDAPPSLTNKTLPDGSTAAYMNEPSWDGGLIVTSTDPLPSQYRIEYNLKGLNFGGQRNGSWDYDGKSNGYSPSTCKKTNYPWGRWNLNNGTADPCNPSEFNPVTTANGFYYLAIMDYAKPAPRNNIFIHWHRKVGMDLYTVSSPSESSNYSTCDATTGEYYKQDSAKSTGNAINALFFQGNKFKGGDKPDMPYNEFMIESECGFRNSDIWSTAEIKPEIMPEKDYTFAIERTATSYTMEMSGEFLYIGEATLRYTREFTQDDMPIWHYNNTPDEYDGQYNRDHTTTKWKGDEDFVLKDVWPQESAYPDHFIIGDPHTNYYEGNATFSDIKLFVPTELAVESSLDPSSPTGANGWYVTPATLDFKATGAGAEAAVIETSTDGVSWSSHAGPTVIDADGVTSVQYRIKDTKTRAAAGSVEVKMDRTAPQTAVAQASVLSGGTATLSWHATDATSGVAATQYRLPKGDWVAWDGQPLKFASEKAGSVPVEFRSTDVAGNVEATQSVQIAFDATGKVTGTTIDPLAVTGVNPLVPIGLSCLALLGGLALVLLGRRMKALAG